MILCDFLKLSSANDFVLVLNNGSVFNGRIEGDEISFPSARFDLNGILNDRVHLIDLSSTFLAGAVWVRAHSDRAYIVIQLGHNRIRSAIELILSDGDDELITESMRALTALIRKSV